MLPNIHATSVTLSSVYICLCTATVTVLFVPIHWPGTIPPKHCAFLCIVPALCLNPACAINLPVTCPPAMCSGVPLVQLAHLTTSLGWSGLEWATGIPASLGGAVAMNAGAHGQVGGGWGMRDGRWEMGDGKVRGGGHVPGGAGSLPLHATAPALIHQHHDELMALTAHHNASCTTAWYSTLYRRLLIVADVSRLWHISHCCNKLLFRACIYC